jgi:hypothetical protein
MAVGKVRTGVILISIGVLLLLNTTGTVDFGFWRWIGKLWPVILIAIGIEKIFSSSQSSNMRNLAWLSPIIIVGVVSYAVIAGQRDDNSNTWNDNWQWNWDDNGNDDEPTSTHTWSEAFVADAKRLNLIMEMSGGRLTVRGGSDAGNLLVARASTRGDKPETSSSVSGDGVYTVKVSQYDRPDHRGRDQWIMKVTDSIPVDLKVEGGAARMRLDLSALKVESLQLDVGAADVDIVLGSLVPFVKCDLECGAAAMDITIPSVAGLRLYRDGVISRLSDADLNLVDKGSHSETDGYSDSAVKVEMRVNSALTSLRLRRASGPASPESI